MKNGLIIDKDGNKRWYLNDLLHREDGPAFECTNGNKYWYLDGKEYTDLNEYQAMVNLKAFW